MQAQYLVPMYMVASNVCNLSSKGSDTLFWFLCISGLHMVHINTCGQNTHTYIIKILKYRLFIVCVCMCVWLVVGACYALVWRSENNVQDLVLHPAGPRVVHELSCLVWQQVLPSASSSSAPLRSFSHAKFTSRIVSIVNVCDNPIFAE